MIEIERKTGQQKLRKGEKQKEREIENEIKETDSKQDEKNINVN
jgi:hypothetical protein